MQPGESDARCWTLWSLAQIVSENARYDGRDLLFADFLLNSHLYGFRYVNPHQSAVYVDYLNGTEPEMVAGSVDEFFHLYLNRPDALAMFD